MSNTYCSIVKPPYKARKVVLKICSLPNTLFIFIGDDDSVGKNLRHFPVVVVFIDCVHEIVGHKLADVVVVNELLDAVQQSLSELRRFPESTEQKFFRFLIGKILVAMLTNF